MMKMINILILSLLLNGCALAKYWPVPHDPALAQAFVNVKIQLEQLDCADRDAPEWMLAQREAKWLKEYAVFRSDIQAESTEAILVNLDKAAKTGSVKACETWLNLTKQRLAVLNKAWSGR
jgi:hypothetical protein